MATRGQENTEVARHMKPVAISVLIGAVCCALALLLMSLIMTVRSVPQMAVDPMASLALALGGFVAGLCCTRIVRENGLVHGALCGAVFTVIVLLAGLAVKDNGFGIPALLKIAFIMLSSMLGGVLGVNTKRRRKR